MPIKKTLSQITIPRTKGKYNLFFEAESKQSCGLPQATDTSRQRFEHVVSTKPTASIHANKTKNVIKDYVKIKVSLALL